jgi:hypothetical protein
MEIDLAMKPVTLEYPKSRQLIGNSVFGDSHVIHRTHPHVLPTTPLLARFLAWFAG